MKNILLIDDDEFLTNMMVRYFKDTGFNVRGVVEAKEGLNLLKQESFDVVVTDIVMPDMDGIELIMNIRRENSTIPIIAMSGGGRLDPKDYLNLASQLGANYTLSKPFHLDTLLTMINSFSDEAES